MRLSIITINYNNASGLERTINSVLQQTRRDAFQYIVVDGNSTDGSKDVLAKYSDNIDVSISEPDTGIYNAMNKGASHVIGEYLLFLNSGDYLYDDEVVEKVLKRDFSEDVVCGRVITIDGKVRSLKSPPKNVSLYTFTGGSLPHPSSFIKKEIFERVGGYIEKYRIMSDWCFWIDALIIGGGTYATIDQTISCFICDGISSTSRDTEYAKTQEFLCERFGRIMYDYLPLQDEAICNVVYWYKNLKGKKKRVVAFPFKVINRILRLRNNLSRRMSGVKIK